MPFEVKTEFAKKPKGLFVIVDDDKDEHVFFKVAMEKLELSNRIVSCYDGAEALGIPERNKGGRFCDHFRCEHAKNGWPGA
jgi:hypothetical protein